MQIITYKEKKAVRLDSYLLETYPLLRAGQLNKFLRENKIKLNGKKLPLNTKLASGDEIKLFIPDTFLSPPQKELLFLHAKPIFPVVFEDDRLLITDKPAGIAVMDEKNQTPDTLLNRALLYLYNSGAYKPQGGSYTPYLCHRLDTGTSGLTIIAKTQEAEAFVTDLIKTHQIEKEYLCVTFGRPRQKSDTLTGYLTKNAAKGTVRISEKPLEAYSKPIETQYTTVAVSGRLALLKVKLITGRTHQIRAHLAAMDCPILGDSKYGNNTANRAYKTKYQALCAWQLRMPYIAEGPFACYSNKKFTAQKPWYYEQILDGTLK